MKEKNEQNEIVAEIVKAVEMKATDTAGTTERLKKERAVVIFAEDLRLVVDALLGTMDIVAIFADFLGGLLAGKDEETRNDIAEIARGALISLGALSLALTQAYQMTRDGKIVFLELDAEKQRLERAVSVVRVQKEKTVH